MWPLGLEVRTLELLHSKSTRAAEAARSQVGVAFPAEEYRPAQVNEFVLAVDQPQHRQARVRSTARCGTAVLRGSGPCFRRRMLLDKRASLDSRDTCRRAPVPARVRRPTPPHGSPLSPPQSPVRGRAPRIDRRRVRHLAHQREHVALAVPERRQPQRAVAQVRDLRRAALEVHAPIQQHGM
jgi:hypothetical protein